MLNVTRRSSHDVSPRRVSLDCSFPQTASTLPFGRLRSSRSRPSIAEIIGYLYHPGGKAADRGLIRYDRANTGDPVRATSQAVPALARVSLAEVSNDGSSRGLPTLAC